MSTNVPPARRRRLDLLAALTDHQRREMLAHIVGDDPAAFDRAHTALPQRPETAHPADCPVPWCEADHPHRAGPEHEQAIADINPGPSTIEVFYASEQPDGSAPYLAVWFGLDYLPQEELDIPFPAAEALADLLQLLDGETLPQFVHALRRTVQGPHQRRKRTRW